VEGTGEREAGRKGGQEVYGRREKKGRKAEFPRWREAGEIGKNYASLRTLLKPKKRKEAGANKNRAGTGIKGYGGGKFEPPPDPLPNVGGDITNEALVITSYPTSLS